MKSIILILAVSVGLQGPLLAQDEELSIFEGALNDLLQKDSIDEDDLRDTVIEIFLECSAFFDVVASTLADTRPNNAELMRANYRFFLTVGMALWANREGMEKVGDAEIYVKAYIENYTLDVLLPGIEGIDGFIDAQVTKCSNEALRGEGNRVISELEN